MMPLLIAALFVTQEPQVARHAVLTIKVLDRTKASDAIAAKADELGGYFTARSDEAVDLRVPQAKLAELDAFAISQGMLVNRQMTTQDLATQVENNRAIIAAREQLLQRYVDALAKASSDGVVSIEREATRLVQEIEAMKGALKLAEHQLAFAQLTVSFQIRDRATPARDGHSSFKWINTVNLADLIQAFQYED
ncbi:MAG TPA: DUF4349 domain-containing protein [Myxococcota bacterium]|nr:DUF4349 domain-containing protein [Myxococcota bacterium]